MTIAVAMVAAVACLLAAPASAAAAEVTLIASTMVVASGVEPSARASSADAQERAPALTSCPEEEATSLPPEPICEIVDLASDEGFFAVAPICDPSGASAVAPPPVHPIGDDRLEATPCAGGPEAPGLDRGRGGDEPAKRQLTSVEPALLPTLEPPPRRGAREVAAPLGATLGPAEGVRRRLEHPPTSG